MKYVARLTANPAVLVLALMLLGMAGTLLYVVLTSITF